MNLGLQGYGESEGRAFYAQAIKRVESAPGVQSSSLAGPLPLDAYSRATDVVIDELQRKAGEDEFPVFYTVAGPGYFATMGTELLQGRGLNGTIPSRRPAWWSSTRRWLAGSGQTRMPWGSGSVSGGSKVSTSKWWAWPRMEGT